MANTSTSDIEASIQQCISIIRAGADYVRFTVPSIADVENFAKIKAGIRERGYRPRSLPMCILILTLPSVLQNMPTK